MKDLGRQGRLALPSQEGRASRRTKAWPAPGAAASGSLPKQASGCGFPPRGQSGSETPEGTLELTHFLLGSLPCSVQAPPILPGGGGSGKALPGNRGGGKRRR